MSSIITQTCNGCTVTLQVEILSVRTEPGDGAQVPPGLPPQRSALSLPENNLAISSAFSAEKGGEKESEKKVAQRKEKEKGPERESLCLAGQLSRIAEAWNSLPLKKVLRFSGKRKERTEALLAIYPAEEIIRVVYSVARSRFLLGGGASHWQVCFDWFIRPENFIKVREGNYLDEEPGENTIGPDSRLHFSAADLQEIDQVWTDSSNAATG